MLATIVDFNALWKILLSALAVGVGLTAVFGMGAMALERLTEARKGGTGGGAVVVNGALVAVAGLVCVAVVVLGLFAITHK